MSPILRRLAGLSLLCTNTFAFLNATETDDAIIVSNERLYTSLDKSSGRLSELHLDDQDLLGPVDGNTGLGPYVDCYCTPEGFWTPGSDDPYYNLITGEDASGTKYAGIVMGDTYPSTGQVIEQYLWLREGETGLHAFSRGKYDSEKTPFLRGFGEFRTLFRPNTPLWTHLSTNDYTYAPLPDLDDSETVQDATFRVLGGEDPYRERFSEWFTKYTFSSVYRDHDVHGQFADGSGSDDGSTFGAWLVMNTKDTYWGGPTRSDLTVDGIVYNYMISNHHGAQVPNITDGFDRTIGPQFYYFNKGSPDATLAELREDAAQYARPDWNVDFYDSIAEHVPNYVPSSGRGTWEGQIDLPAGAKNPLAILAINNVDYQDNSIDTKAYQYWSNIDSETGTVTIPRVKADTYRLTIYADGIFGQYTQNDITITANITTTTTATFREDTAGTELWRIGTPDKSSGEYRHGYELDTRFPLRPQEYRIYWAEWDFPTDFPDGVAYTIGEDDVGTDLNYVHWSVFGGKANAVRPEPYYENVSNWTLSFTAPEGPLANASTATLTVLLAGAKTAAGNTDAFNASEPFIDLPYTVNVNGADLEPWFIPYNHSSSCAVRSSVTCYQTGHKFVFDAAMLNVGENEVVLSLPENATNYEPALLAETTYVQYDALRLEVD